MKSYKNLSLLLLGLLIYSCNEKISPELEAGLATSGGGSATPTPASYTFGVSNGNLVSSGYNMHKTGAGNWDKPCEMSGTIPMSSEAYIADPGTYDISCFMEAEELALYLNGLNMSVSASVGACENVAYSPYSFYQYMAGDSTSTLIHVECDETVTDPMAAGFAGTPTYGPGLTKLACGEITDLNVSQNNRGVRPYPGDPEQLCNYNHSNSGGPNCDIGTITVVTRTLTVADPVLFPGVVSSSDSLETVPCGGAISECIAGPIKEMAGADDYTRYTEITAVNTGSAYSGSVTVSPLIDDQLETTVQITNYRRHMANKELDYISSVNPQAAPYIATFSDTIINKTFEPEVASRYAANQDLAAVAPGQLFDTTLATWASGPNGLLEQYAIDYSESVGYTTRPISADPHLGVVSRFQVNPFYTFYCLDDGWEIKGRIRVAVRDWDRVYTPSANLEFLSDIHLLTPSFLARQDTYNVPEVPYDPDSYNGYNDLADWDDFLFMQRTFGIFAGAATVWSPVSGWFEPDNFPKDDL